MKKVLLAIAVFVMAICANAQKNQYFWYQGNLMMGNPIAQIDSVTFGEGEPTDTLHIMLPRTIIKTVHDTLYVTIHDTICPEGSWENGILPGVFSVSSNKQVKFSQGNLQFNAMGGSHKCADGTTQQGIWRFAKNQWDFVGDDTDGTVYNNNVKCNNELISSSYNGWIDLFGEGTSGWSGGASCHQPWATTAGYGCGCYKCGNYEGTYADWGKYNAIENGGNTPDMWRVLNQSEWNYLLDSRTNASQLKGLATINNVKCLVLLPDNWNAPAGVLFTSSEDYSTNQYSAEQWHALEVAGAVALPAAGLRAGSKDGNQDISEYAHLWQYQYHDNGSTGQYWVSTGSYELMFYHNRINCGDYRWSCWGSAVRLVQDVK